MERVIATAKSPEIRFSSFFPVNGGGIEGFIGLIEGEFRAVFGQGNDVPVETGAAAGVTGSGPDLLDVDDQRVLIAIGADFDDFLDVAGGFSLVPQFLTRTGVVNGLADFESEAERFRV